jgi:hypothetical protein
MYSRIYVFMYYLYATLLLQGNFVSFPYVTILVFYLVYLLQFTDSWFNH